MTDMNPINISNTSTSILPQVNAQEPPQHFAATSQLPGVEKSIIEVGFNLDGSTTYCCGIHVAEPDPMQFANLTASSAGRCPLVVDVKTTVQKVKVWEPVNVDWKIRKNDEVKENLFPSAWEPTGRPKDVIAAFVKACKVGTNCKPAIDPQAVDSTLPPAGPFNEQNEKLFPPFRFYFADSGEYIITAKVTLPGDPALDISGMQFLTASSGSLLGESKFGDNEVSIAPSSPPAPAASSGGQLAKASPSPASASSIDEGGNNITNQSAAENKFPLNSIIIMGTCALCFVIFIIVSVISRLKKRHQDNKSTETHSNTLHDERSHAFPSTYMNKNSTKNHRTNSRTRIATRTRGGSRARSGSNQSNVSSDGQKCTFNGYNADGLLKPDVATRINGNSIVDSVDDSMYSPTSSIHSKAASKWSDTMSNFDDSTKNSEFWYDDDSRDVSYATSPPGTNSTIDRIGTEYSLDSFESRPSYTSNADSYMSHMTSFSYAASSDRWTHAHSNASSRSSSSSMSSWSSDEGTVDV
jgi:hypothetical protein